MLVEIWSDVVCPWCAIGKARFERALERFEHRDEVSIRWRSFELDRDAPTEREGDYATLLARKYGTAVSGAQQMIDRMTATAAEEGWTFRFDRVRPGNTFDAHRLLHLARDRDRQHELKDRLLTAYLCEGEAIGRPETLQRQATAVGLDADEVATVLAGDRYAEEVRADEQTALELGVTGVPFFAIDRRFGIPGAQPTDTMLQTLQRAWSRGRELTLVSEGHDHMDGDCSDGACAV